MSDFMSGNGLLETEDFIIFAMSLFLYKNRIKIYLVDSISCVCLNQRIPSAIASYPVLNVMTQCSESIHLVINYGEPITSIVIIE